MSSPENKSPISFLNYYQVQTETLPELINILTLLELERGNSNTKENRKELIEKELIPAATAALKGWNDTIGDYNAVNNMATSSQLENVGQWFTDRAEKSTPLCEYEKTNYNSTKANFDIRIKYRCTPNTKPDITEVCNEFDDEWKCEEIADATSINEVGNWVRFFFSPFLYFIHVLFWKITVSKCHLLI